MLTVEEENARCGAYYTHESDKLAALAVGITVGAFAMWRLKRGFKNRGPGKGRVATDGKRKFYYSRGYSDSEIASFVGASRHAIRMWRKRRNLAARINHRR